MLDTMSSTCCSNRTEVLGKPMARGHVIPADMGTTRAFGMTYNSKVRLLAGLCSQASAEAAVHVLCCSRCTIREMLCPSSSLTCMECVYTLLLDSWAWSASLQLHMTT